MEVALGLTESLLECQIGGGNLVQVRLNLLFLLTQPVDVGVAGAPRLLQGLQLETFRLLMDLGVHFSLELEAVEQDAELELEIIGLRDESFRR